MADDQEAIQTPHRISVALGPPLKRLDDYGTTAKALIQKHDDGNMVQQDLILLKRQGYQMKNTIKHIESLEAQWWDAIGRAIGDDRDMESKAYDDFKYNGVHFSEFVDGMRDTLLKAQVIVQENTPAQTPEPHPVIIDGTRNRNEVRLPKLELPTFNGNPLQWTTFWQQFEFAVDKQRIADVQKMNYLVSRLRESALRAVEGYAVNNDNYTLVVDALKKRFGDDKVIAEALEAELINLPQAGESVASLRATSEAIDRICRQFSQLGKDENSAMFLTTIKAKLPRTILRELVKAERQAIIAKKPWKMSDLRKELQEIIIIREEVGRCANALKNTNETNREPQSSDDRKNKFNRNNYSRTLKARVFEVAKRPNKPERRTECLFCGRNNHWAAECRTISDRNERVRKLADQKRCFKCLKQGHQSKECQSKLTCKKCNGNHHYIICNRQKEPAITKRVGRKQNEMRKESPKKAIEVKPSPFPQKPATTMAVASVNAATKPESQNLLMATYAKVGRSTETPRLIFFDAGSQLSFVKKSIVETTNFQKTGGDSLEIYSFGNQQPGKYYLPKHFVEIEKQDGTYDCIEAYATKYIGAEISTAGLANMPTSNKVSLKDVSGEPDVLIGIADFWKFFRGVSEVQPKGFIIHTTLGDIPCGEWQMEAWKQRIPAQVYAANAATIGKRNLLPDEVDISEFWSLESIGITDDPEEKDDERALENFHQTLTKVGNRYAVSWPWKEECPELPSNYQMAYSRLLSIYRKLQTDPELLRKYDAIMREQLERGIIEAAERKQGNLEHYLPHHPVVTHKLRQVFDGSAHIKGMKSLNQCLFRGPVILPELVGLLLRFRKLKYPLLADIEKAFLQIELHPNDREVTKFLWVHDLNKPPTGSNLAIFRFRRVPFGVISSPFLLAATLKHHLNQYGSDPVALEMRDNAYVDNIMMGGNSLEELEAKFKRSRKILADASMNLREFITQAPGFMEMIPKEYRLETTVPKVLGIPWDLKTDTMIIKFPKISTAEPTRRTVLKTIASVFDPLGLACPCLLKGKLMFQKLWDNGHTWNTSLSGEEMEQWELLQTQWSGGTISVPRNTEAFENSKLQLHTFVDASKDAYACAVYLKS